MLSSGEITNNPYVSGLAASNVHFGQNQAQTKTNNTSLSRDNFQAFSAGPLSSQDIGALTKLIARGMGVSELVAFKLLRKLMSTGSSVSDIQKFLNTYINEGKIPAKAQALLAALEASPSKNEKQVDQALKPIVKNFEKQLALANEARINFNTRRPNINLAQIQSPGIEHLTKLVSSPREFASWLVNNKAAFIALRSNPEFTYILASLQNPRLQQSPILISEIVKLMTQLLKLKAGKATTSDDTDENARSIKDEEDATEIYDHEHNIVNTVKTTVESLAVKPVREFLIEAERFAEEEVANLWSLTLKREKELEKQLSSGLKKFNNQKNNNKK
ncbi:MAG: hypothetical protein LW817_02155 [Candidatus Caenarcaniphilales bacterium]|jgi:hypothetical protein|nr:hypothetical protein [Candidatus Caenarcaniphilales bacterium]